MGVDAQTALLKMEAGEADIIADLLPPSVIQQASADAKWADYIYTRPGFIPTWLWMNAKNPPLDDVKVRQAILHAVDVEKIQRLLTGVGGPLYGIYAPGAPGYDATFRPYVHDPERAKQLLAEAGHPDGFSIDFFYTDEVSFWEQFGPPIQQDLAAVGIQMQIQKITAAAKNEMAAAKTMPLHVGGWGPITIDSADWVASLFTCAVQDQPTGYASYCNPEVDELYTQTKASFDQEERAGLFRQIEDTVMADAPMVPLINVEYFVLVNPRVKGYSSHLLVPPVNPWVWLEDT
jgi:ABC-type transport system substrate-binding protein